MVKFKKKAIILNGNTYYAESIIGNGQFGVVYLGRPKSNTTIDGTRLPKQIAIKEYFYSRFYDPVSQQNKCEEYWQKEVESTRIQGQYHAAQMKLIDAGKVIDAGRNEYYIVLTYIPGKTLRQWYADTFEKRPHLDEEQITQLSTEIVLPLARHLDYCHSKGLIHRDLTVDNILIIQPHKNASVPVVIDWGAAKLRSPNEIFNPAPNYVAKGIAQSTAFMNKGTPPEVIMGLDPLAASDIYMLGHIMYFLFTGGLTCRTPKIKEDYNLNPLTENPSLNKDYAMLVEKCTPFEPAERISSMDKIIHILEKLEKSFSPAQITYFGKPKSIKVNTPTLANAVPDLSDQNNTPNGNISNLRSIPSPILGTGRSRSVILRESLAAIYSKTTTGQPGALPSPYSQPVAASNAAASPYGNFQQGSNPQGGSVAIAVPVTASPQNIPTPQVIVVSPPQAASVPDVRPTKKAPFPVAFMPDQETIQYAQAFLSYFQNPRWEYLRQDYIQYYYILFNGAAKALESKSELMKTEKILGNIYYVGRTIGSLDEVKNICNYFQKVLQRVPTTKIVFLGNYFNYNKYDLETFTLILSFYCLYPQNVTILRGSTEEKTVLENHGLLSHLRLKFGGYSQQIFDLILRVVSNLDLLHLAQFPQNVNIFGTGGGLPYDPNMPYAPLNLMDLDEKLSVRFPDRTQLDIISQSIFWGSPNELADQEGSDSNGNIYFSWSQLNAFFKHNQINYLIRGGSEQLGHRIVWNLISSLNSSSLENNREKREAKILRVNPTGISDLAVKDLKFYFDRDYIGN
jgi:serine/threonine protein kinase